MTATRAGSPPPRSSSVGPVRPSPHRMDQWQLSEAEGKEERPVRKPDYNRRVVVTGLGVVSPVGNDVDTAWNNLIRGNSGIGEITRFDSSKYEHHWAGEVRDF